jgi:hypothetical protein
MNSREIIHRQHSTGSREMDFFEMFLPGKSGPSDEKTVIYRGYGNLIR